VCSKHDEIVHRLSHVLEFEYKFDLPTRTTSTQDEDEDVQRSTRGAPHVPGKWHGPINKERVDLFGASTLTYEVLKAPPAYKERSQTRLLRTATRNHKTHDRANLVEMIPAQRLTPRRYDCEPTKFAATESQRCPLSVLAKISLLGIGKTLVFLSRRQNFIINAVDRPFGLHECIKPCAVDLGCRL
jgi:hypothetical protein